MEQAKKVNSQYLNRSEVEAFATDEYVMFYTNSMFGYG